MIKRRGGGLTTRSPKASLSSYNSMQQMKTKEKLKQPDQPYLFPVILELQLQHVACLQAKVGVGAIQKEWEPVGLEEFIQWLHTIVTMRSVF